MNLIGVCLRARAMKPMPSVETLTTPGKASIPGILLHEYAHLSLNVPDYRYGCMPQGVRRLTDPLARIKRSGLGALVNPDSYRCWAEDAQVGALAVP